MEEEEEGGAALKTMHFENGIVRQLTVGNSDGDGEGSSDGDSDCDGDNNNDSDTTTVKTRRWRRL